MAASGASYVAGTMRAQQRHEGVPLALEGLNVDGEETGEGRGASPS